MSAVDPAVIPLLHEEVLNELRQVMGTRFNGLLHHFLSEIPLRLNQLQTALIQGDSATLYRTAHPFKSSCGSMGAARLAELLQRLEHMGRYNTLDHAETLLTEIRHVADETIMALQARFG